MSKLSEQVLRDMTPGAVHKHHTAPVNSMDFDPSGEFLVTAGSDESINVYRAAKGSWDRTILCKKYGCDLIKLAPAPQASTAVHTSSNDNDHTIRYLSLHSNKYIRYFKGHVSKVVSLAMSPSDDTFLSAGRDSQVRLWDVRTNACQGKLPTPPNDDAAVGFDPQGLCFVVCAAARVLLYDVKNFTAGPFKSFSLPLPPGCDPSTLMTTGVLFSPDARHILVNTNSRAMVLIDSFTGDVVHSYTDRTNASNMKLEASFSPDGQFLSSGSEDGNIYTWNVATHERVMAHQGHDAPPTCVRWSPVFVELASAASEVCLWTNSK